MQNKQSLKLKKMARGGRRIILEANDGACKCYAVVAA